MSSGKPAIAESEKTAAQVAETSRVEITDMPPSTEKEIVNVVEANSEQLAQCRRLANLSELVENDDLPKCCGLLEYALVIIEEWLDIKHPVSMEVLKKLGRCYFRRGMKQKAKEVAERLLEIEIAEFGNRCEVVCSTVEFLADIYQGLRRLGLAEDFYERALKIAGAFEGQETETVARLMGKLGSVHYDKQNYGRARALFERALLMQLKSNDGNGTVIAVLLQQLAEVYYQQRHYSDAEECFSDVLRLRRQIYGDKSVEVAETLSAVGKLHSATKKFCLAEVCLLEALEIQVELLGAQSAQVAATAARLSGVYMSQGEFTKSGDMKELSMLWSVSEKPEI